MMKTCRRCGESRPFEDFPFKNKTRGWRRSRCKPCSAERLQEWLRENPSYHRDYRLRKYGLTPAVRDEMLSAQGGVCAICGRECPTGNALAVDHDHASGKVRGLLCRECNLGLGCFSDDPDRLVGALAYLLASEELDEPSLSR